MNPIDSRPARRKPPSPPARRRLSIYRAWMAVARVLGRINTTILLALVYYLVVTPIALVFRLIGRDALRIRRARSEGTLWLERPRPADRNSYFNQY